MPASPCWRPTSTPGCHVDAGLAGRLGGRWSPSSWSALLGTLAELLVLRRLATAPFITKVIVTLGLLRLHAGRRPAALRVRTEEGAAAVHRRDLHRRHGGGQPADRHPRPSGWPSWPGCALFLRGTRLGLATRSCAQDRARGRAHRHPHPGRLQRQLDHRRVHGRRRRGAHRPAGGVHRRLVLHLPGHRDRRRPLRRPHRLGRRLRWADSSSASPRTGPSPSSEQPGIWALAIFVAIAGAAAPAAALAEGAAGPGDRQRRRPACRTATAGWWPGWPSPSAGACCCSTPLRVNFWAYTASLVLVLRARRPVDRGRRRVDGAAQPRPGRAGGRRACSRMLALRNDHGLRLLPARWPSPWPSGWPPASLFGVLSLRLASTQVAIATLAAFPGRPREWLFTKGLNASEFMPVPAFLASDRKLFAGHGGGGRRHLPAAPPAVSAASGAWPSWPPATLPTWPPTSACGCAAARLWAFALSGAIAALAGVGYGTAGQRRAALRRRRSHVHQRPRVHRGRWARQPDRAVHRPAAVHRRPPDRQVVPDIGQRPPPAPGRGHGRAGAAGPARGAGQLPAPSGREPRPRPRRRGGRPTLGPIGRRNSPLAANRRRQQRAPSGVPRSSSRRGDRDEPTSSSSRRS